MKRMAFCDTTTGIRLKERVTESCASLSKGIMRCRLILIRFLSRSWFFCSEVPHEARREYSNILVKLLMFKLLD